jgi:small-conductance mechanosensitive channel
MDIKDINSAIMFGNFTNEQLNSIGDAIRYARAQLTQQNKRAFQLGDTVKFTSNRNGLTYVGTVRKVKIKYVLVNTPGGLFNVPANMLEAA